MLKEAEAKTGEGYRCQKLKVDPTPKQTLTKVREVVGSGWTSD